LLPALPIGRLVSEKTGEMIAQWVGGGAPVDQAFEEAKRIARDVATMGTDALRKHWGGLPRPMQTMLKPILEELKALAAEADRPPEPEPEREEDPFDINNRSAA
jgi:hypothetical protein